MVDTTEYQSPADRAASLLDEGDRLVSRMLDTIRRATDPESEHLSNSDMLSELEQQERQRNIDRMLDAMGDDGSAVLDRAVLAVRRAA